jgi:hypothetical protein
MFGEIHRHFVLFKIQSDTGGHSFKQIVVFEQRGFEVRIHESDCLEPNLAVATSATMFEKHCDLESAILTAEREYKSSVKMGWRAITPTMSSYGILMARRAVA